ncbi:MAG: hypothetical protein M1825_006489 [Sarcosagium campestre]|nr:MAG: hypothetical protein M1825_006489 [Sarcosagium campestre]
MEVAIRWSPHSSRAQQRFLILNLVERSIKLHQVDAVRGKHIQVHQISQHDQFPNVRAFDWSPTEEGVVAVGLPTGEASLLRVDDDSNDVISFSVKNQRLCNAISLSSKNLLASGLDKVRNDFCLNIWDINHRLSTWNKKARGWGPARPQVEPIRKLATSETISSIKFFTDQPDSLVTGVKGQVVRVYDLRESPGNPAIQFSTRCTHNLSIDPQDENYFASASSSGGPVVCVWDRRMSGRPSSVNVPSINDSYQAGAVLEIRNFLDTPDQPTQQAIWSVRYSKCRRGCLGILSNDGQLAVYETIKEDSLTTSSHDDSSYPSTGPRSGSHLRTRTSQTIQHAFYNTNHGQSERHRVVSFDFMSSGRPGDEYKILAYRADGILEVFDLNLCRPSFDTGVRAELVTGTIVNARSLHTCSVTATSKTAAQILEDIRGKAIRARAASELSTVFNSNSEGSRSVLAHREEQIKNQSTSGPPGFRLDPEDLLALTAVEQRRAQEGYLFDCARNIQILVDDTRLQDLWRWIAGAEEAAETGGMVSGRLDLAFIGVKTVCTMKFGNHARGRFLDGSSQEPTQQEFVQAVTAINKFHKRTPFSGVETKYPEQRQLCLAICGWAMSAEEFEAELHRISEEETTTKAAAWALFHGQPKRAVEAVFGGSDSEKLVAMAIAGYYNMVGLSKHGNEEAWISLCTEIGQKARDPYSRAILALVSTEDWKSVIAETSLPLRDRIGVALMFLPDDEVRGFLDDLAADCIASGDIEGICLTGITPDGMDLFQSYIANSGDVQTAVLVMSNGHPRYIDDFRFPLWSADYCGRLSTYKLHVKRALFETAHSKRSGQVPSKASRRQISVRCRSCDQAIAHDDSDAATVASTSSTIVGVPGDGSAGATAAAAAAAAANVHNGNPLNSIGVRSGTSCPKCGRRLPRCAVCMMWLGVPDPRRARGGVAPTDEDSMARFMNFCNVCLHGYHAHHATEWFSKYKECPVPECKCLCAARERFTEDSTQ